MAVDERFQGANVVNAGILSPYWGEHSARYVFALPHIENKNMLDIACGTGYGLSFLQTKANSVVGVDLSLEAAKQASKESNERVSVMLGNGTNLPFADESFDIITSFETIEHVHQRSLFLSELKRVLKKKGKLIISTPNAYFTKPINGQPKNEFHVYEYKPEEFRIELENHFEVLQLLGQTFNESFSVPPFQDEQRELPKTFAIQTKLFFWRVMNKFPLNLREGLSQIIWKKPFYPTENDYEFKAETLKYAPVLVAVCLKATQT